MPEYFISLEKKGVVTAVFRERERGHFLALRSVERGLHMLNVFPLLKTTFILGP